MPTAGTADLQNSEGLDGDGGRKALVGLAYAADVFDSIYHRHHRRDTTGRSGGYRRAVMERTHERAERVELA
jgi:hypothetical protein